MKRILTPREWFDTYVNKDRLLKGIINAIDEAVQNDSVDFDGENYLGLVHDIVNSGHYTPFLALQYFDYDIDMDNVDKYEFGEIIDELDNFTHELEEIINNEVLQGTGIKVLFGHWESDGSYCMMAIINKNVLNTNKGD